MGLKPEILTYLQDRAALGLPQVWQAPLAQIRENTKLHVALNQSLDEIYSVESKTIQGPTSELPIRIYRPSDRPNMPALLFFTAVAGYLIFSISMNLHLEKLLITAIL